MAARTITFHPKMGAENLKKIAEKLDYPNVSRFIEDAVTEKVSRELSNPKAEKLTQAVSKVICEHMGWKFYEPDAKLDREIKERADRVKSGKDKSYRFRDNLKEFLEQGYKSETSKPVVAREARALMRGAKAVRKGK